VSCDDGNPCTDDPCHPELGCINQLKECDDGNTCTFDLCDPKTGECVYVADQYDCG